MNKLVSVLRSGHVQAEPPAPRGQILLVFAFGLIVFIGFAALTVDVGSLYVARRNYQNATDAAALAGAAYLTRPINDACVEIPGTTKQDCARRAAWGYLNNQLSLGLSDITIANPSHAGNNTPTAGQLETPTSGGAQYRIWVSTPPNGTNPGSISTVADKNSVIFVRVDRQRETFFGKIFVPNGFNVSAWATAGVFPNRYAVITLRRGRGNTEIDPGPANTTDIKLAGNGSELRVVNGDVGGNWGMKLTADSKLRIYSTTGDEADVYLTDYQSCGQSCWASGQVIDNSGNVHDPKKLPAFVPDPNYKAPPGLDSGAPNGQVNNADPIPDIPNGDGSGNPPSVRIRQGSVSGATCVGPSGTASDAPRIGPGTYGTIRVDGGNCLILDPVFNHSTPENVATDVATPVRANTPNPRYPGIFYITNSIDLQNRSLVIGDGVTVVMRPDSSFLPSSGAVMDLNTGKANGGTALKLGGWTTKGATPYANVLGTWVYQNLQEANPSTYGVGIALYVLKPSQAGLSLGNGTDVIKVSSQAGLAWKGVTYAPNDNVAIAGQPSHDGIGQLVSWTFTFNGGTNVTQTYDGPGDGFPYLIEPCVLVGGSCQ